VGCWRSYLSGARCRLAYGPADATATHCLLLGFTFLVPAYLGSPGQRAVNRVSFVSCLCPFRQTFVVVEELKVLKTRSFPLAASIVCWQTFVHCTVYVAGYVVGFAGYSQSRCIASARSRNSAATMRNA